MLSVLVVVNIVFKKVIIALVAKQRWLNHRKVRIKKLIKKAPTIDVLDKIRAEIMKLDDINPDYPMDRTIHISRNEVLQIIDKYKAESEDKE